MASAALIAETMRAEGLPNGQTAPAPAAPPTGPFTVPPLPYAYDALEPYFDAETMHLHHDKHHQAYVNNLNAAVAAHPELAGKTVWELVENLSALPESARTAVRNQGGGHANHSFWWPTLGKGPAAPTGELSKAINAKFGSPSDFQAKLTAAAMSVFGSGWAWLVKMPDGTVAIETTPEVQKRARRLRESILPGPELGLRERAVCRESVDEIWGEFEGSQVHSW
jgi:Fe-Mn family superoxide dismutase